jgi:hypothetical protein
LALAEPVALPYTSCHRGRKGFDRVFILFLGAYGRRCVADSMGYRDKVKQFHALLSSNMVLHQPLKLVVRRKPSDYDNALTALTDPDGVEAVSAPRDTEAISVAVSHPSFITESSLRRHSRPALSHLLVERKRLGTPTTVSGHT